MPRRTRSRKRTSNQIKTARIGRFDGELKVVPFRAGDTVAVLASKAGLTVHQGEEINDDRGNTVLTTDTAKAQDYFLTGKYSNGNSL